MTSKITFALLALVGLTGFASAQAFQKGDTVFQARFDDANDLKPWAKSGEGTMQLAADPQGKPALVMDRPAGTKPGATACRIKLPAESLRGCRLSMAAMIKADNVATPPHDWNGVKFMLYTVSPSAGQNWQHLSKLFGTFDWKPVKFMATVPKDATEAWLCLGVEETTGKAWYRDIHIKVAALPRPRPTSQPTSQPYTGHDENRLRGAMIHPNITPESLQTFGQDWNANLIRWQLIRSGKAAKTMTFAEYDAWLEGELRKLEAALPLCEKYGLGVVLDLHSPPGGQPTVSGYVGSDSGLFSDKAAQDKFVEVWRMMARRFRDCKVIWGFDLANEPVEGEVAAGCDDWQALATRAARAVREIDATHAIIVEPAPGGGPGSLENLTPLPVPGVVYSVHMYEPGQFTHQGVHGGPTGVEYPGKINGKMWDKDKLRRVLQPVRDWQRDYGIHIYIGEFSAIRWAPDNSACRYLKDVIDLFEEFGWDWSYHAFREWDGWSVEHGDDPKDHTPSKTPTDRENLLRSWYAKNIKPAASGKP